MPAKTVPPALRDQIITEFRQYICDKINFVPFEHQAAWWATTDGYDLTALEADPATPLILCYASA